MMYTCELLHINNVAFLEWKFVSKYLSFFKMVKRKLAYVCDVCGLTEKDFTTKKNFFEHVQSSIHTNLKFKCDQCDLEF